MGQASGGVVTFLKTYDTLIAGYDAVHYEGTVFDAGLEINGTWSIPGNWSGTFIMVRSKGLYQAVLRRETVRI
jgi:hypothetical protein